MQGVSITATLQSIRTETSGGWRITFDVPDDNSEQVMELSKLRDLVLELGIVVNPDG